MFNLNAKQADISSPISTTTSDSRLIQPTRAADARLYSPAHPSSAIQPTMQIRHYRADSMLRADILSRCLCATLLLCASAVISGCGTTKSFTATEQLLVSDAVDSTVSQIDFRPLSGRKVYLDNTFIPSQKGVPNPKPDLVHSEYVTSSLRQQMMAAGVMLCEKRDDADVILEARLGALGFDGHTVSYGIPASSSLSSAANSLTGVPAIPAIPEISFARKEAKNGAAKLALFAYERQTLQPVWQSGIARASSTARDTWLLGVGPLQNGTIYDGARFAGGKQLKGPVSKIITHHDDDPESLVDYKRPQVYALEPKTKEPTQTADAKPPQSPPADKPQQASATEPPKPVKDPQPVQAALHIDDKPKQ